MAEVLRADRENLSFHAAAWPRRPFDLPIARTAFASGGRRGRFRVTAQRAYSILNKIVPDECGGNVIGK